MIIYLLYMFAVYIESKILTYMTKEDYMQYYKELKQDLIDYLTGKEK